MRKIIPPPTPSALRVLRDPPNPTSQLLEAYPKFASSYLGEAGGGGIIFRMCNAVIIYNALPSGAYASKLLVPPAGMDLLKIHRRKE